MKVQWFTTQAEVEEVFGPTAEETKAATEFFGAVEQCWNYEGESCPEGSACHYPMQCQRESDTIRRIAKEAFDL